METNNQEKILAYCFKCKEKREMINPIEVEFKSKNGKIRKALTSTCPVCGTKLFRFISTKEKVEKETVSNDDFDKEINEFNQERDVQ